jgi:hypothetical protein
MSILKKSNHPYAISFGKAEEKHSINFEYSPHSPAVNRENYYGFDGLKITRFFEKLAEININLHLKSFRRLPKSGKFRNYATNV